MSFIRVVDTVLFAMSYGLPPKNRCQMLALCWHSNSRSYVVNVASSADGIGTPKRTRIAFGSSHGRVRPVLAYTLSNQLMQSFWLKLPVGWLALASISPGTLACCPPGRHMWPNSWQTTLAVRYLAYIGAGAWKLYVGDTLQTNPLVHAANCGIGAGKFPWN